MPVGALPVAMIQASFFASLMPTVGVPPLIQTGSVTALQAAIAMSAIAMGTDVEDRVTLQPTACPLPEVCVIMGHHRHRWSAGWTTTIWLCQLRTSSVWADLAKVRR